MLFTLRITTIPWLGWRQRGNNVRHQGLRDIWIAEEESNGSIGELTAGRDAKDIVETNQKSDKSGSYRERTPSRSRNRGSYREDSYDGRGYGRGSY